MKRLLWLGRNESQHATKVDGRPDKIRKRSNRNRRAVVERVERGGEVRIFYVDKAKQETVQAIVRTNIVRERRLNTDESKINVRYCDPVRLGITDKARVDKIAAGIEGKRLTHRRTYQAQTLRQLARTIVRKRKAKRKRYVFGRVMASSREASCTKASSADNPSNRSTRLVPRS